MSRFIVLIMLSTLLLCVIVGSSGRRRRLRQKVGVCPILLSPQVCWNSCDIDNDCHGDYMCCGTGCGGRVCASPTDVEEPKPTVFGNPFADYTYIAYLKHIGGFHCSVAGGCWIRSFCLWMENAGSKPSNCI